MITYTQGDATKPVGPGPKIIPHVCNDLGGWGRGFVLALSKRWPQPENSYRQWRQGAYWLPFELGYTQLVEVETDLYVANMIAQHAYGDASGPPIRYDALDKCLDTVAVQATQAGASVHMPRIGAGLAGGDWNKIEQIINDTLVANGVAVTVYDWSE